MTGDHIRGMVITVYQAIQGGRQGSFYAATINGEGIAVVTAAEGDAVYHIHQDGDLSFSVSGQTSQFHYEWVDENSQYAGDLHGMIRLVGEDMGIWARRER